MVINKYKEDGVIMGRVPHGADLLEWITEFLAKEQITLGTISLIGAVSQAAYSYYDQAEKTYHTIGPVEEELEILSAIGNISLKDGEPFAHIHIVFSDDKGKAYGGHLVPGTIIFAGEFHITMLSGPTLQRGFDETTGLYLWQK
jgi:hypothetical protein